MKNIILLSIITLVGFFSNAQCSANFTWTASGNTVQFTNTSSGTNVNNWSFGDGGNSSATNPTYTYSSAGTYTVCLTAYYQDSTGGFCIDTLCQPVTVQGGGGTSCDADFTWTVSGNTVFFNNTSTGTNMNDWSFGDGGYSGATNPTYTYSSPGTYWVCLYSYYSDSLQTTCSDSTCYQITVQDSTGGGGSGSSCDADFTWTVSGTTVFFNNTSTGTNMNDWSFDDGNYSSATSPTHTYATSGTYWVCLYSYYYDSLTTICGDSVCYQISVFDSLDSTASAVTLSLNEFRLYPNPTNSVLNIQFDQLPSNSHALIVDMLGREMIEIDLATQITEVQVADFPRGVYLVQLLDTSGQVIGMSRFVKE
jgi:PKD repeat protein